MGVYINMEMPKNCEECAIKSWDTEDYVCPFSGVSTLCISRQADCPLVPVPDHGRLIDADKLMDALPDDFSIPSTAAKVIEKTIIPAEEGET